MKCLSPHLPWERRTLGPSSERRVDAACLNGTVHDRSCSLLSQCQIRLSAGAVALHGPALRGLRRVRSVPARTSRRSTSALDPHERCNRTRPLAGSTRSARVAAGTRLSGACEDRPHRSRVRRSDPLARADRGDRWSAAGDPWRVATPGRNLADAAGDAVPCDIRWSACLRRLVGAELAVVAMRTARIGPAADRRSVQRAGSLLSRRCGCELGDQVTLTLPGATPREATARQPLFADIDGFGVHAAQAVCA